AVSIKPTPTEFGRYLPAGFVTDLQNKPYIWLTNGPQHCVPTRPDYDPTDCPSFDQTFPLTSRNETIDVSVEKIMSELGGRLSKVQAASEANAARVATSPPKIRADLPYSTDLSIKQR